MSLRPLFDKLLVKPFTADEKTKGGIVLPESAQEKPNRAKVLAVGPGRLLENGSRQPLSVAVGDTVVLTRYSGTTIKEDGEEYLVVAEHEIIAVVNND